MPPAPVTPTDSADGLLRVDGFPEAESCAATAPAAAAATAAPATVASAISAGDLKAEVMTDIAVVSTPWPPSTRPARTASLVPGDVPVDLSAALAREVSEDDVVDAGEGALTPPARDPRNAARVTPSPVTLPNLGVDVSNRGGDLPRFVAALLRRRDLKRPVPTSPAEAKSRCPAFEEHADKKHKRVASGPAQGSGVAGTAPFKYDERMK